MIVPWLACETVSATAFQVHYKLMLFLTLLSIETPILLKCRHFNCSSNLCTFLSYRIRSVQTPVLKGEVPLCIRPCLHWLSKALCSEGEAPLAARVHIADPWMLGGGASSPNYTSAMKLLSIWRKWPMTTKKHGMIVVLIYLHGSHLECNSNNL